MEGIDKKNISKEDKNYKNLERILQANKKKKKKEMKALFFVLYNIKDEQTNFNVWWYLSW